MKLTKRGIVFLATICFITLGLSGATMAQQKKVVELTYGTPYGADAALSVIDKRWMDKVEKEANGLVKFKPYWGGSIIGGRDVAEQVTQGAIDIALINPTASKSGFPITKASMLFFYGTTQEIGGKVFKELRVKFPEIEKEYKGMKVLCWAGDTSQLITRKPVRRIADLKGIRIKVSGDISEVLKQLGVEGLSVAASEVYVAMQKGILDGAIVPYFGLDDLKLTDVAKYVTVINLYRTHTGMRVMNLEKYNSLSPDIKRVLENNIEYYAQANDAEYDIVNKRAIDGAKKSGIEFIPLSNEELAKFYAPFKPIALKEAQDLDAKGLPGTKILNETRRLIDLYTK